MSKKYLYEDLEEQEWHIFSLNILFAQQHSELSDKAKEMQLTSPNHQNSSLIPEFFYKRTSSII